MVTHTNPRGIRIFVSCSRILKTVFFHSLTIVIFAPTFVSFWEDRPLREPLSYYLLWWEDTQYSDGYSQRAFNAVKVGDDINEVNKKLGSPLFIVANDDCSQCSEDGRNKTTNFYSRYSRRSNYWFAVSVTYNKKTNQVIKKTLVFDD